MDENVLISSCPDPILIYILEIDNRQLISEVHNNLGCHKGLKDSKTIVDSNNWDCLAAGINWTKENELYKRFQTKG